MSIASPLDTSRSTVGIAATALLLVVLAVLLDGPIWLVKLVPTQDGPVHLAQADLIARFGWGGTLEGPAASFYQWNARIEPNSAIYLLLAGLIRLTRDALIAHSLFLTLYGLLWIGAALAVSRAETEASITSRSACRCFCCSRAIGATSANAATRSPSLPLPCFWLRFI